MLIIGVILESYQSLKDKTLKLVFSTQEPTPEQLTGIASAHQDFGYLAFKKDVFKSDERHILEGLESDYEDKGKTPSKRLKNVLFVNWKQNRQGFDDFAKYYDHHMEKMIDHWKGKIED